MTIRRAEINYESSTQADELHKIRARQERISGSGKIDKAGIGSRSRVEKFQANPDPPAAAAAAAANALARMEAAISPAAKSQPDAWSGVTAPNRFVLQTNSQRADEGGSAEDGSREAIAVAGGQSKGLPEDPLSQGSGRSSGGGGMVARMIREREENAAAAGTPLSPGGAGKVPPAPVDANASPLAEYGAPKASGFASSSAAVPASPGSGCGAPASAAASIFPTASPAAARAPQCRDTSAENTNCNTLGDRGAGGGVSASANTPGGVGGSVGGATESRTETQRHSEEQQKMVRYETALVTTGGEGGGQIDNDEEEIDDSAIEKVAAMALQVCHLC